MLAFDKINTLTILVDIPQAIIAPESDSVTQLTSWLLFKSEIWPMEGRDFLSSMNLPEFNSPFIRYSSYGSSTGKWTCGYSKNSIVF